MLARCAELADQGRDAVERLRRIQRHFEDANARLDESLADRQGLVRPQPAQDRDDRHGREGLVEARFERRKLLVVQVRPSLP